jgi:hypothetical protein
MVDALNAPSLKKEGVFILEAYTYQQTTMEGIGGPATSQKQMLMSLKMLQLELVGVNEALGIEKQRVISKVHVNKHLVLLCS